MSEHLRIRAQRANYSSNIEIAICTKTHAAKTLTMEPISEAEILYPMATINKNEAQELMDDLWHAGIRPSDGTGNIGQLQATQQHLKDMREITFKKLGMETP